MAIVNRMAQTRNAKPMITMTRIDGLKERVLRSQILKQVISELFVPLSRTSDGRILIERNANLLKGFSRDQQGIAMKRLKAASSSKNGQVKEWAEAVLDKSKIKTDGA